MAAKHSGDNFDQDTKENDTIPELFSDIQCFGVHTHKKYLKTEVHFSRTCEPMHESYGVVFCLCLVDL